MITRRKLQSLSRGTRLRKAVRLIEEWEHGQESSRTMLELLSVLNSDSLPPESSRQLRIVLGILSRPAGFPPEHLPRELNGLRHSLMKELGIETADWDFRPAAGTAEGSSVPAGARVVLPCRVYVDGIRSPFNLGSLFRTAECFGAREILIAPGAAVPDHPRALRSAMGSTGLVPYRFAEYQEISESDGLFALELGGTPLHDFEFPRDGVCVVGSEELGIRRELRTAAEKKAGIVSIPLLGVKGSLNVSVAFGILMHAWSEALTRDS